MTKFTTLAMLGALAFSMPAFAETPAENERELKADKQAISKDNAAIKKHEQSLEKNRAEKEAAKANKEYGKQAKESVSIGANKAAIAAKKGEKKVDQKILEKDQADRQDYSQSNRSSSSYRADANDNRATLGNMSPSAGVYYKDSRRSDYPVTSKEGPAAKL